MSRADGHRRRARLTFVHRVGPRRPSSPVHRARSADAALLAAALGRPADAVPDPDPDPAAAVTDATAEETDPC